MHRISDEFDFFFDPIRPKTFEKLVEYCKKHYSIVSFETIDPNSKRPQLVFSFDDGYYDFIENAIPILAKYDLPSNHNMVNICLNDNVPIWTHVLNDIFNHLKNNSITNDAVIANHGISFSESGDNWIRYYNLFFQALLKLNKAIRDSILSELTIKYKVVSSPRMMNWEDAKRCQDDYKVEIGSHTYTHDILSTINSLDDFDFEVKSSLIEMESKLGKAVKTLALPNGQFNERCLSYLQQTKLKRVLFVNDSINESKSIDASKEINRIYLVNEPIEQMIFRVELLHNKLKR